MDVLIAEDDAAVRGMLETLVLQAGDRPFVAANGTQAWELWERHHCGAVLTDLMMPGIDGIELVRRIREHDSSDGYTYVILLTAHDTAEALDHARAAGVDDYLIKPVGIGQLSARLAVARRIGALQKQLSERNRLLIEANRRMRRDLATAAAAQKALLPTAIPDIPGISCGWRYQPREEGAGDLPGFQRCADGSLVSWLFDVSGHGITAALTAVQVARVLGCLLHAPTIVTEGVDPVRVLRELNTAFHRPGHPGFITLVLAVLHPATRHLRIACCGHPAPLIARADGSLDKQEMDAHPLGVFPSELLHIATWDTRLAAGDRLLLVSDGVLDAPGGGSSGSSGSDGSPGDEPFGSERLAACWRAAAQRPLEDALTEVMDTLARWRGRGRLGDDVTVVAISG